MRKDRKKEDNCYKCGRTVIAKRKGKKLCRSCKALSLRWKGRRAYWKGFGIDLGGFENCVIKLKFVPKIMWKQRRKYV